MEKLNPDTFPIKKDRNSQSPFAGFEDDDNFTITGDIAILENSNDSSLKTAFRSRALFKAMGTPVWIPRGFDFLDKGSYYGKVDTFGRAILPKRTSLVEVDDKFLIDEEIFLNKYTYQLYLKFYEMVKLEFALDKQQLSQFMEVFKIDKGAGPREEIEESYITSVGNMINEIYMKEVFDDTTNIKDTAMDFVSYLDLIFKLFTLHKIDKSAFFNEYVKGGENSMLNSGLMFEIENVEQVAYDDNAAKFAAFYQYPMYNRVAGYFLINGLRYDSNVPWRFAMDLNLDASKTEISGISKEKFFENNFELAEGTEEEMELFYRAIFKSYLNLLETAPLYYKSEQKTFFCSKSYRVNKVSTAQSFDREIYSEGQLEELYRNSFNKYLIKYAQILNSAYGNRPDVKQILLDLSNKIKKGLDKKLLVRYTFNKMKYC